MGIIDTLLGSKTAITSDMIQAKIEQAEGEIDTLHSKLAAARSGIMLLSDSEHQAVEQSSAATKRAIDRLDMRIAHLNDELPALSNQKKRLRPQPRMKLCVSVLRIAGRRTRRKPRYCSLPMPITPMPSPKPSPS